MSTVTTVSRNSHVAARIFSLNNLYLAGKNPLLFGEMLVNFRYNQPETSKSSACWDMGGHSHLTRLSTNSLYVSPKWIELELLM